MQTVAQIIDSVISASGKKAGVIASELATSDSVLSTVRHGTRAASEAFLVQLVSKYVEPARQGQILRELLAAKLVERIKEERFKTEAEGRMALEAIEDICANGLRQPEAQKFTGSGGRSLAVFPEAFEPLAVVTGDKREDGGTRLTAGDFGVASASPADTRWIFDLGLKRDTLKHVDKNFVLLSEDELISKFSELNLLVIGSPAANHLARRINDSAIFRFNYTKSAGEQIDQLIKQAREALPGQREALRQQENRKLTRPLFTGGIFDPLNSEDGYLSAQYSQVVHDVQYDWGIVSFAANPFYVERCRREKREHDFRYVSILAAGIHHPGTAHALKSLGASERKSRFEEHPYGGILRVTLDVRKNFAFRTEEATAEWEDEVRGAASAAANGRGRTQPSKVAQRDRLLHELEEVRKLVASRTTGLQLTEQQVKDCIEMLNRLGGS